MAMWLWFLAGFITCLVLVGGMFVLLGNSFPSKAGLDTNDLLVHLKHANNALMPGGFVQVRPSGSSGNMEIQKPRSESNVTDLHLRIRSGDWGRDMVAEVSQAAEAAGIKHSVFRTPKRGLYKEVRFPLDITGSNGIARFRETLDLVTESLTEDSSPTFRVRCVGLYRPDFFPEDGIAIPYHFAERLGVFVGSVVGTIVNIFRNIR